MKIKDVQKKSDVSKRQLRNYLKKLKMIHPFLVTGGRKGNGGEYQFDSIIQHFLKLKELCVPTPLDLDSLGLIEWKWFGCYRPVEHLNEEELIQLIPIHQNEFVFYSIHTDTRTERNHIHFISSSKIKPIPLQIKISNDLTLKFKPELMNECISYLTNTTIRQTQRTVEYGVLLQSKIENKRIILRL